MKAATTAKIARLIIIVSVVVILAIPTYSGIQSMQVNNGEIVATDAVYELDCMNENDLAQNITNGITKDGSMNSGYSLSYGTTIGTPVKATKGDIESLATTVKASGAKTATLLDPEGKIVKQQTIVGSKDFCMYVFTGLKLTGSAVNMITPEVTLNSYIDGKANKISDVDISKASDSYRIKIEIPALLVATAMGAKNPNLNIGIGVDYNSLFKINLALDLPASTFIGDSSLPEIKTVVKSGETYDGVKTVQSLEISSGVADISAYEGKNVTIGGYGTDDGGVKIKVDNGKLIIMSDKAKVADALNSSRNSDGTLTVKYDSESYTLDKEMTDSLISMADSLIKQWSEESA